MFQDNVFYADYNQKARGELRFHGDVGTLNKLNANIGFEYTILNVFMSVKSEN